MNSFTLRAIGNLARNPEFCARGGTSFARFCLVGSDEVTEGLEDGRPRQVVTTLWFFAFGEIAVAIARQARKGDQLILEAGVIVNVWTENGQRQEGHTFIVTGYRFGAKRGNPPSPCGLQRGELPDKPQPGAAELQEEPMPQHAQRVAAG